MFNQLNLATREAFKSIYRSGAMPLIAVFIVAVTLFVFGSFSMLAMNLKNVSLLMNDKLDIMVYIKSGSKIAELENAKKVITGVTGVKKVQFIPKEEAWQKFKANYSKLELDSHINHNPLPDAFKISVDDMAYLDVVINKIKKIDSVDEIRYGKDLADKMHQLILIIDIVGLSLIAILFFATLTIVINTIRLTIIARQKEIDVMSLVGATRGFICLPFIVEGLIIGGGGGVIAVGSMIFSYSIILNYIKEKMVFIPLSLAEGDLLTVYFVVIFFGLALGGIGSYLSVNKAIKIE